MLVDAKSIISRLTKTAVAALQASVVHAMNAGHYEVTVEHMFHSLLENAESDVAFLAMHYDLDPTGLKTTLARSLEGLRTGNAGKPTFSPRLLDWFQDSFTVGSLLYGYNKVRTGVLFSQLVTQGSN
ncbi:MAG TPA: type VI secretion system ATPase TssH, partial [Sorangium sp.]|nr:type VI secretion system ATPase TssH [Sorangium sp.]